MAAIHAAERGRRVLLLEKNRKPGVKILMSGGTRCNITHATDNRGIVEAYGPPGKFLHSALAAFSVRGHARLLRGRGRRHQGRGDRQDLPRQQQGRRRARRPAAPACTAAARRSAWTKPVADLRPSASRFAVATSRRTLNGATGSSSPPAASRTPAAAPPATATACAAASATRIVPPRPALVPLTSNVPWVAELRGITLPDVARARSSSRDKPLAAAARLVAVRPLRAVRAGDPRRQPGRQRPRRTRSR